MRPSLLKRLWTPYPTPRVTHYLNLHSLENEQAALPQNAAVYGLLHPDVLLQERFLVFAPLSFLRRLGCRMLHAFHTFRSRFQDIHTLSWWSSSYSPHPAPAYCHTLRIEAEGFKRTLHSLRGTPHFKGIFPYTTVMRAGVLEHLNLSPTAPHLIIRILPSGLYEEWLQKGPHILRHQRFQLPDTALCTLENPNQRMGFMDQKILQLLEELKAVGLEQPHHVVVLWPFETRRTLQSGHTPPEILICNEGQILGEALKTYTPPRHLSLTKGFFSCAAPWGNALRRMNLVLFVLVLGLGGYTGQIWQRVESYHHTWQNTFEHTLQCLQQEAQPFLAQQGLWDPDWDRTLTTMEQARKAIEHISWVQNAHETLVPLLLYAQDIHQGRRVPRTSFHISSEHIRITRQDTPEYNQAWIAALERGPYRLTITQEALPLPPDTGDLLAPKPVPLEKITVIVPLRKPF